MALTLSDVQTLLHLVEEQPSLRMQFRWLLVTDEMQALSVQVDQLTRAVGQLAQAQQRTEERLEQLAEAQRRTEERLERLEATVQALAEAQRRTEERLDRMDVAIQALTAAQRSTEASLKELAIEVRHLTDWQRGETGLREGERYERLILKRAPLLFVRVLKKLVR